MSTRNFLTAVISVLTMAVAASAGCGAAEQQPGQVVAPADQPAECGELYGHGCEWIFYGHVVHDSNPLARGWVCQWQARPGDSKRAVHGSGPLPKCVPECCGPKPPLPEGYTEDMIRG